MKNIPNWSLSLGVSILALFVVQMSRQAARSAETTVLEKIATHMCSESTATLRRSSEDDEAFEQLIKRSSQAAMKTYSDPMIVVKQLSQFKDAEAVGMQIYRNMKRKCARKVNILFN